MGAQHVNDERPLRLARRPNMGAKQRLLPVVIIRSAVEAGLANRDATCRGKLGDEVIGFAGCEVGHDLRMDAERKLHEVVLVRKRAQARPRRGPDRRYENRFDARRPRTRNNFVAIAIEEVDVEVAMRIEHATAV
jgi:hypothetical protein